MTTAELFSVAAFFSILFALLARWQQDNDGELT